MRRYIPERRWQSEQVETEERELGLRDVEGLGFVNLFHYFTAAAERYEMGEPIDVNAAVLKAEWVWPLQPDDYYWTPYIKGRLDIAEVPGNHDTMVFPENATKLAAVLRPLLDANEPIVTDRYPRAG